MFVYDDRRFSFVVSCDYGFVFAEFVVYNTTHCYSTTTHVRENTTKLSGPEDGHMVARNMLSNW